MSETSPHKILADAAAALKQRRPAMSVRAVAAKIGVSASYWSKVLRGERNPSAKILPKIIEILEIDLQRLAQLQSAFVDAIEKDKFTPTTGLKRSLPQIDYGKGFREFGRNEYWLLEEWFYLPILNLITLAKPPKTPEDIADRLGLRIDQTKLALQRLQHFGFLRLKDEGGFDRTELQIRFPTSRSHDSVRKFHLAMIQKAQAVLKHENYAEGFASRLITGVTFAGTSDQVNEAKLILEEALFRAANLITKTPKNDALYQINLQFFPLSGTAKKAKKA